MPATGQHSGFEFGVFQLDLRARELRKHGVRFKLQEQPLRILALLLERAGEVVTREDIQKRLWADEIHVDFDNAINSAIRKLREALGDSPENPRFVETVARRGYRFIAPVSARIADHSRPETPPDLQPLAPLATGLIKPANGKHRLWWMAVGSITVLVVTTIMLRPWLMRRNQTVRDSGLPAVPLTGNSGYEAFPTFSPEGTRVAFSWEEPGKEGSNIYVKLIGHGDPVRLTTSPTGDLGPVWSPDGRWIAFLRTRGPSEAAIMLTPALGGQERHLADIRFQTQENFRLVPQPPPFLAWSADGRWLLSFEQQASSETSLIIRVSTETGQKNVLSHPGSQMNGDGSLAVSPDGKTLAFTRSRGLFERDIYTVSLAQDMLLAGEPRQLTFDNREIHGLAWTANSRGLVFSSNRSGRPELWRLDVRSPRRMVRLTEAGDGPLDLAVSRQENLLVYSHQNLKGEIWRLPLHGRSGRDAQLLISSSRGESHPKYSPDGERIAFESNRSGNDEIWTCNGDGSHPVRLTTSRNARSGSPRWSPDGKMIAFDGNASGNWDIYVISAQGGQPSRLTKSETNEFRPSWSHDGKWIYYTSLQAGDREIWKVPADGGAAVQVTRHGARVAYESADGESLYYTKSSGLWRMPVRGGEETQLLSSPMTDEFAPTKRGIYFLQSSRTTARLNLLNITKHAVETIAVVPGPSVGTISVSPDGRWIIYNKYHRGSELMVIEKFE